jgi:hypothetical protein
MVITTHADPQLELRARLIPIWFLPSAFGEAPSTAREARAAVVKNHFCLRLAIVSRLIIPHAA